MDTIYFMVNGERCILSGIEVSPNTSLNDYLHDHLGLYGTKAMCQEGGCGACVVSVSTTHQVSKEKRVFSVNSCLVHILSCHQWEITTIEGLGNCKDGYHPLQKRIADYNGTQCGYCTPGWIMNMHSLQKSSGDNLSTREIERAFGGNMCRCTGYRPILDAFKSFAKQSENVQDLEDLHQLKCTTSCDKKCDDEWCFIDVHDLKELQLGGNRWFKAYTLCDVFKVLKREGGDYQLVAGNTGKAVYPNTREPRTYIDISSIDELQEVATDDNLILGAGINMTEFINICRRKAATDEFSYLKEFVKHLELVAHVPVRNIGTIGGNLMLKNKHHDFSSDIFLLFETVGGCVTTVDVNKQKTVKNMRELLKMDMTNKIILNVKLPPLSSRNLIRTYKIMPRGQNAHAIVNAGFLFHVDKDKVISSNIVFGNIGPDFIHAKATEDFLKGKDLFSDDVLKRALCKLEEELEPVENPPEPSPSCRKAIALGLFYKAILSLSPTVNPRYKSGGSILERPVSHGTQTYDTDKSLWPLNQPVAKLEALTQSAGEARFAADRHNSPRDVHVAFVLSTVCLGEIQSFDAADALKIPGVIAFYTAKDIPGRNSFTPTEIPWITVNEEILSTKKISYYGQPIALIVAKNHKVAVKAAGIVKVVYTSIKKPILNVKDALYAADKESRIREDSSIKPTDRGTDVFHTLKGTFVIPDQYHYTMETQSCTVSNTSRGLVVRSATQWMDLVQAAVAKSLDLPLNSVTVEVSRIGGGYGGKASRSSLIACACALAAHKLNTTATLVLPLTHNMAAIGKRQACYTEYEVAINKDGMIQYANVSYYSDNGCSFNDSAAATITDVMSNLYDTSRWEVKGYSVLTDKASNTWCRAPGTTEAAAIMEHIMERIAFILKKDSLDIKQLHIKNDTLIKEMIDTFKIESKYEERKVEIAAYNAANAWTKKSIKTSLMSFPVEYGGNYPLTVSVYHVDGTVLISHGGIEMGQGINTKVAQVCAHALQIPLETVKVKGADSFVSPNAIASSGSITSECVAFATVKACQELLKRLEPVKQEMNEPTWPELVKAAFDKGINLQVNAMTSDLDSLKGYSVNGICSAEVILDVLTGTHQILRVDLTEDTGQSLNPALDVGQIEGAFVMGLGLWTSERLVYAESGRLLTDRTWNYKPPGALDIPVDFRVNFKRNSYNSNGVLRSKATGEPALLLAVVVTHALQEIISEAAKEYGSDNSDWIHVDTPYCVENIIKGISPNIVHYKLK